MQTHMLSHQQKHLQKHNLTGIKTDNKKRVRNEEKSAGLAVLLNERSELRSTIFGGKLYHTLLTR